jgi:hypothetical protein
MKRLAIVAIVLSLSGEAAAQSAGIPDSLLPAVGYPSVFDMTGGGARARGMGNAYLAAGDDATALTWNPAGIHAVDKTVMTFGFSRFMPRGQSFTGPDKASPSGAYSGPGAITFVSPFRLKGHGFAGGVSYTRITDESFFRAYFLDTPVDPDGPADLYDTTHLYLSLLNRYHAQMTPITLGVGTRLSEKVAAGFSINILNGRAVEGWSQHLSADSFFVLEYYPQKVQYDQRVEILDSSKFSGVTFTLGFKYEDEKFSVGVVGKLPYQLRQTTNRTIDIQTRVNGQIRTNGTFIEYKDNRVSKIAMPFMFGVGGAYKPNESSTLALDVEVRPFSGKKITIRDTLKLIPGAKDEEVVHTYDPEWRNVVSVRAGGEYLVTTSSRIFPTVPLRAGFSFVPLPDPDRAGAAMNDVGDVVGNPTGTASGINLSLGTGVYWSQVRVDLAYAYRSYDRMLGVVKSEIRDHLLQMTFTGYF